MPSGRGRKSRFQLSRSAPSPRFGATLFWMVTCGRQPAASWAHEQCRGNGRQSIADRVELVRDDAKGDAAAQVHQPGDRGARRRGRRREAPAGRLTSSTAEGGRAWNMVRWTGTRLRSAG